MSTRTSLFIIVIMVILTSCSPSPAKRYAKEMSPAMESLSAWDKNYKEYQNLFITGGAKDPEMSRLEQMDWYNDLLLVNPLAFELDIEQGGFSDLEDLLKPSQNVATDGKAILDIVGVITPPEEIQAAHNQMVSCINKRILKSADLSGALVSLSEISIDMVKEPEECTSFTSAFTKVEKYVEDNK